MCFLYEHLSLSQVIYLTGEMQHCAGRMSNGEDLPMTAEVAGLMKTSMMIRKFSSFSGERYLLMATILVPRFKCLGLRTEESVTSAKNFLKAEIVKVILLCDFQISLH